MSGKDFFKYPSGDRMCASGQRRAALEAMDLLLEGGNHAKEGILQRAAKADHLNRRGASVNKHDLISLQVVELYMQGLIELFIDPTTGDYTMRTYDGREFPQNVWETLFQGKKIY